MCQNMEKRFTRYASIIDRQSKSYYDRALKEYKIGCGQQFFLLWIYESPGVPLTVLSEQGRFDKGTTTKAVQKLKQLGYIRSEQDEKDKRMQKLFVEEKAIPVVEKIYAVREKINSLLSTGFTEEEEALAGIILKKMSENAGTYLTENK